MFSGGVEKQHRAVMAENQYFCSCKRYHYSNHLSPITNGRSIIITASVFNECFVFVLIQLTTGGNSVHVFAAWNEEQYESWVECLRYSVLKREELSKLELINKTISNSFIKMINCDIIFISITIYSYNLPLRKKRSFKNT